jgi:hypothetical protein
VPKEKEVSPSTSKEVIEPKAKESQSPERKEKNELTPVAVANTVTKQEAEVVPALVSSGVKEP